MELYKAALSGAVRGFKRNPRRSLTVEEGLICQETELAWRFARRAREVLEVEEAKASRANVVRDLLLPIVSADELLEKFNRGIIQTEPEEEETNES